MLPFIALCKKIRAPLLVLLLSAYSLSVSAQWKLRSKNKYDNEGNRHGYWEMYGKTDSTHRIFKGRFTHGNQSGRCVFYYEDGTRYMILRYKNDSLARMKRYDMQGNLELKGWALWLSNEKELRFCWDGDFVFYDSRRKIIGRATYIRGEEQYTE